jgi:hypothetical protein
MIFISLVTPTDYRYECVNKGQSWDKAILDMDRGLYHLLEKNLLVPTSYLLPLASKTSFTEWYANPSRAPTLIYALLCHFGLH